MGSERQLEGFNASVDCRQITEVLLVVVTTVELKISVLGEGAVAVLATEIIFVCLATSIDKRSFNSANCVKQWP